MPSRRGHKKSTLGCKLRRVKCDETRPQCKNCLRRHTECSYRPINVWKPEYGSAPPSNSQDSHTRSENGSPTQTQISYDTLSTIPISPKFTRGPNELMNEINTSLPSVTFSTLSYIDDPSICDVWSLKILPLILQSNSFSPILNLIFSSYDLHLLSPLLPTL